MVEDKINYQDFVRQDVVAASPQNSNIRKVIARMKKVESRLKIKLFGAQALAN